MQVLKVRNVNEALGSALIALKYAGKTAESRNGPVTRFPYPVVTEYTHPEERVLFSPIRNANPAFHLFESIWMLAGRDDVQFPATLVKNMTNYSDNGSTFFGAYGFRWRKMFGYDQLAIIINELRQNPDSRRCVLQMWNAMDRDLAPRASFEAERDPPDLVKAVQGGKDVPCNTAIYFEIQNGRLNMTVTCRSNDILWGAYGANAVHMSVLMEYVARAVGVSVGTYYQFSNNLHLYHATAPADLERLADECFNTNIYLSGHHPMPLWHEGESQEDFDEDVETFFLLFDKHGISGPADIGSYETDFFNFVIRPMLWSWLAFKEKNIEGAKLHAEKIAAPDWSLAMRNWVNRNFVSKV